MLCTFLTLFNPHNNPAHEASPTTKLIFQVGKPRLREVKWLAQSDKTSGRYKIQTAQSNHKDHALTYKIVLPLNSNLQSLMFMIIFIYYSRINC